MSALDWVRHSPLVDALGWTLVHSLWQGLAMAVLLAIAMRFMRSRTAAARYVVTLGALMALPLVAGVTFGLLNRQAAPMAAGAFDVDPAVDAPVVNGQPIAPPIVQATTGLTWEQQLRPMLPWLVVAWAGGVVFIGICQLGGWMVVRRMRCTGTPLTDTGAIATFLALVDGLAISRPVTLARSALVEVPTVIGWLRPVVLLPINALTGLTSDQLRGLLAHELAHVRRCDYLVNVIQTIVETLLFYHPAVWWMGRLIRQERENACDDLAAAVCDRTTYAQALASMEMLRQSPAPAMGAKGGALLPRIRRILGATDAHDRKRLTSSLAAGSIGAAIVILLLVVSACSNTRATSADDPSEEFARAESVKPSDLVATISDYRIGKNDLVGVSIMDLQAVGTETVKQARVSESGLISLPLVGQVNISGLTEAEAEKAVASTYENAGYLANAQVSVTLAEMRSRNYSILGAVKRPGQYVITKSDYRLLDALACAGGETLDVKNVFVLRKIPGNDKQRIIKVPLAPLHAMDLKYNLVIQPDDLLILRPPPQASVAIGASTKPSAPTMRSVKAENLSADYRVCKGDLLFVIIGDMQNTGMPTEAKVRVTDEGMVTLPHISNVLAEGQTTFGLAEMIGASYRQSGLLSAPVIQVTVLETVSTTTTTDHPATQPIAVEDLHPEKSDYKLAPDDKVSVSIWDLTANGVETKREASITESGNISMPLVGNIKIAAKTIVEAEKAIAKTYQDAGMIRNANVMVTLLEARSRSFSILFSQNSAGQSGQYTLPTSDFRLLDALAMSKAELQSIASIKVMRAGEKEARVLQISADGLLGGDANFNVVVRPKDTLIVQTRQATAVDPVRQQEQRAREAQLKYLDTRLSDTKVALAEAKSRYSPQHPAVADAQRQVDMLTQQIDIARSELADATSSPAAAPSTAPTAAPPVVAQPSIEQMQALLAQAEIALEEAKAKLGPKHPRVRQGQAKVDNMKRSIEQARAATAPPTSQPTDEGQKPGVTTAPANLDEQMAKAKRLYATALDAESRGNFDEAVRNYEALKQMDHDFVLKDSVLQNYLQYAKDHLPQTAGPQPTDNGQKLTFKSSDAQVKGTLSVLKDNTAAHFVRLVVGTDRLTLQGEPVTLETLKPMLEEVPDRANTALELAIGSDDVTIGQINKARSAASGLVHDLGFKYLTEIGEHPLGSKAGDNAATTQRAARIRELSGEYYMGGHVQRVGVYSLTGRKIHLTQAIYAAGGFDDPKLGDDTMIRVVHRKDGKEQVQEFVWRDLKTPDKDPILQPDDVIEVGTTPELPTTQPANK